MYIASNAAFFRTLTSIHEFMKIQTDITWARRFMKKTSIENALTEYAAELEDAAQSFQVLIQVQKYPQAALIHETPSRLPLSSTFTTPFPLA